MMRKKEYTLGERLAAREGRGSSGAVREFGQVVYTRPLPDDAVTKPYQHDQTILKGTPNEPVRTGVPNRPGVMTGTNPADAKPRIWKSGSSQVEDK